MTVSSSSSSATPGTSIDDQGSPRGGVRNFPLGGDPSDEGAKIVIYLPMEAIAPIALP